MVGKVSTMDIKFTYYTYLTYTTYRTYFLCFHPISAILLPLSFLSQLTL